MDVKLFRRAVLALLLPLLIVACQDLFTFSPFSFLRRDPSKLSAEQRIAWAEDALASGDPQAMAEAYAAIEADALGSPDAELTYLAASLALELSGVPELLYEVLGGGIDFTDSVNIENDLDSFLLSLDPSYVVSAGTHFLNTLNNDPSVLSGTDYILGAGCLVFKAAEDNNADIADLTQLELADAKSFIQAGIDNLSADDPAMDILTEMLTAINGF